MDAELVWSPNTNEIIYSDPFKIKAVSISASPPRIVDGRDRQVRLLSLSRDGSKLYYLASPNIYGSDRSLYRVSLSGSNLEVLADSVVSYLLAPVDTFVAITLYNDSLFLFNVFDRSRRYVAQGIPKAFSPDGKQLVVYKYGFFEVSASIVSLNDGTIRPISGGTLIRWDTTGLRAFDVLGKQCFVRDVISNASIKIWETQELTGQHYMWSPDGNKLGLWTFRCVQSSGFFNCDLLGYSLYMLHIPSRSVVRIAYGNTNFEGGIVFSPDGRKIGYILDGRIYMKDIP